MNPNNLTAGHDQALIAGSAPVMITDAPAPFDDEAVDPDCILRTSDEVDFRAHKLILSIASAFFRSMFNLPEPTTTSAEQQELKNGLPVVTLQEDASILDILLRRIYPPSQIPLRPLSDHPLSTLMSLYEAVDKYDLKGLIHPVMEALLQNASQDALTAYAWGLQLTDVVQASAIATLDSPIDDLPLCPELEHISAAQFQRLLIYRRRCQDSVQKIAVEQWGWIENVAHVPLGEPYYSNSPLCSCRRKCTSSQQLENAIQSGSVLDPDPKWNFWAPRWWLAYMIRSESALKIRPRGGTVTQRDFLAPTLGEAISCTKIHECRRGTQTMLEFVERFAAAIEDAVAQVDPPSI
ncbi:uncharacterized protein STEHIDRAFT_154504 [Stereum hirsutum FP-91666 SS1]|uniref:uncharacterized protein n=1 Tax=Stereum hirsutum (strain FP-91666) TaxID=721885 RepID=UPI000440E881|nr:uncharacterized protein STEHIDRAFT_154504 [Stereum hirsutum FP-91666 SS1]EIM88783.1 hypothetical protein STEHIDRAFT_154504 [Stereum hirsutum FP-91666 SS1]